MAAKIVGFSQEALDRVEAEKQARAERRDNSIEAVQRREARLDRAERERKNRKRAAAARKRQEEREESERQAQLEEFRSTWGRKFS